MAVFCRKAFIALACFTTIVSCSRRHESLPKFINDIAPFMGIDSFLILEDDCQDEIQAQLNSIRGPVSYVCNPQHLDLPAALSNDRDEAVVLFGNKTIDLINALDLRRHKRNHFFIFCREDCFQMGKEINATRLDSSIFLVKEDDSSFVLYEVYNIFGFIEGNIIQRFGKWTQNSGGDFFSKNMLSTVDFSK